MADASNRRALRRQYVDLLAQYGLRPRNVEDAFRDLLQDALRRGDEKAAQECRALLRSIDPADPPVHPAQLILDDAAAWIEGAIRSSKRHQGFTDCVYVSEFPVGSVNALSTCVDGGFLVLLNSGLLVLLKQMLQGLCLGGSLADEALSTDSVVNTLAAALRAYVEYGDSLYGPTPLASGTLAYIAEVLTANSQRFVVAHEYGHILRGHFDSPTVELVSTTVGDVDAIAKSWDQEYAADEEAYELLIETQPAAEAESAPADDSFVQLAERQAAVAAPFVTLLIFGLVEDVMNRFGKRLSDAASSSHPPILERQRHLAKRLELLPRRNWKLLDFCEALTAISPKIIERAVALTEAEFGSLAVAFDAKDSEAGMEGVRRALDELGQRSRS